MAEVANETKLIQDYETIRQREYQLITGMLDILPKIEKVGEDRVNQVRDALFHADHPFLMVFVGPFNSGKSSIINALLGAPDLLKSGPTPTTDRITLLRYGDEPHQMMSGGEADTVFHPSPMLRRVSFVDTPGLESTLQEHEEITRKFLHRCDVVMLVMLVTRAMTASNLQYLQTFREYGKKVIVVLNQIDLIDDTERETVRQYVQQQSKDHLGFVPEVWLVSSKLGMDAYQEGKRDAALWQASGLHEVEAYIQRSLGDADRLRQKLQTPLQIVQNVHQVALTAVRSNQSTFDQYRAINDNVLRQLEAQKREQERSIRDMVKEIEYRFTAAADRSSAALHDLFQFSRALQSLGSGLAELTGLSRLLRRKDAPSPVKVTFDKYRVFEPIEELTPLVDKLAPQLEGQDMQDIDDLVKYGQREVSALPIAMRDKLIGTIQAPAKYDRTMLQEMRPLLETLETQARTVEPDRVEMARRNTLLYLAVWELIMVILVMAVLNLFGILNTNENNTPYGVIALLILLMGVMGGFALLPLRGRTLATSYANRLLKVQAQYIEALTRAADKHIEYGMKLRRDAIAPLTRLVEAQAAIQDEQLKLLKDSEQQIGRLEADLNAFGKRSFLGIKM